MICYFSISEMLKIFKKHQILNKIKNVTLRNLHLIVALFLLTYTLLPVLSPILFKLGLEKPGWWIQTLYRLFCHQRPERSFFLFGEQLSYSLEELSQNGYKPRLMGYTFVGNEQLGYKIAFCSRDLFLYGAMSFSGLFVSFYKKEIHIKWWVLLLLVVPMVLDGGTQLVAELLYFSDTNILTLAEPFYLSNNLNRSITGSLFGAGMGIFIHSELKRAVQDELIQKEASQLV
jgi:uncharacterized membrane protein